MEDAVLWCVCVCVCVWWRLGRQGRGSSFCIYTHFCLFFFFFLPTSFSVFRAAHCALTGRRRELGESSGCYSEIVDIGFINKSQSRLDLDMIRLSLIKSALWGNWVISGADSSLQRQK